MKIQVLKPGLLIRDNLGMILEARSTVILIQSADHNIIVDTGVPGDRADILDGLARLGFKSEDIDILINTHLHVDHCGNNSLFSPLQHLVHPYEGGFDEWAMTAVREGCEVDRDIWIIATPGHTRGSISVVIRSPAENLTYVAAGDALPIHDNYLKWVPPGIHFDPEIAIASMQKIVDIADVVIPGHDKPFKVMK